MQKRGQGEQFEHEKSNSNARMGRGDRDNSNNSNVRTGRGDGGDSNDSDARMGTWGRGREERIKCKDENTGMGT